MTIAVCFRCGEIKRGAFTDCPQCKAMPRADDELMVSLAFTDHYFESGRLREMSQYIKSGGQLKLDDATKEKFAPAVQEAKRMLGIGATRQRRAGILRRILYILRGA